MEKGRTWPWKKKITEKLASAALEFKQSNEQLDSHFDLKDQANGMTALQQAEAKIRILTEQLSAKDEVVLQHARVAEEAVSGWEKADSETATVKEQLDAETQKRFALEDRVAHLDGALKECMRQLRHVREQQEQKIHEAIVKKTREWEEIRSDMDVKMAKLATDLRAAEAEKATMTKLLQERTKAIMEAKEGRSNAEQEAKLLQVKLENAEKEQNKWKYELHLLSQELQIRNEELEYSKKESEAASKQHLENVKKVAKLETECQRLRLLVRKKLPGPAAISQMRLEVEALGILPTLSHVERGRRMSPSRRMRNNNFWKHDRGDIQWMAGSDVDEEQFFALIEENKALREALSKSSVELEAARMQCVHAASNISYGEEQLENTSTASSYHGVSGNKSSSMDGFMCPAVIESSKDPSVASVSEDGAPDGESSCAESWANALVSELSHIHKEKGGSLVGPVIGSCDLMDDFAEMERLASLPSDAHSNSISIDANKESPIKHQENGDKDLSSAHSNTQFFCKSCGELQSKLSAVENELNIVRLQRVSVKAALSSIEKRMATEIQGRESSCLSDILEELRSAMNEMQGLESKISLDTGFADKSCSEMMESAEVRDMRVWSPMDLSSCQSDESTCKQDGIPTSAKVNTVGRELMKAMHKVASLMDSLSQVDFDALNSERPSEAAGEDLIGRKDDTFKQWRSSDLDSCVQSLVTLCNGLLQGKVEVMDFLLEITSALDWLMNHLFSVPSMVHETNAMPRQLGLGGNSDELHDSQTSNAITTHFRSSQIGADNSHLSTAATFSRNDRIDSDILKQMSHLKAEKEDGDEKLKALNLELEDLKSQLEESRFNTANLQDQLASTVNTKDSLVSEITDIRSAKNALECELLQAKDEIRRLEEKAESLEVQLQDEVQCRKDIEAMYQEVMGRKSCSMDKKPANLIADDGSLSVEEAAAKIKKVDSLFLCNCIKEVCNGALLTFTYIDEFLCINFVGLLLGSY
ncbi:hypothetical protein KP509_18G039000 [Ceratopteris richardii]|uniref:Filament-like plant protein 7 n=1 Tax=Ceratopteris richardii TaxID=49495 RepID=A0A8T2SSL8_CERRI|nr:hypothetical protein KP509_18G039000 [Ceratopteris richardii]